MPCECCNCNPWALAVHAMDVVEVQTKIPSWEFSLPFLHYHIRILSATAPVERIDVANSSVVYDVVYEGTPCICQSFFRT